MQEKEQLLELLQKEEKKMRDLLQVFTVVDKELETLCQKASKTSDDGLAYVARRLLASMEYIEKSTNEWNHSVGIYASRLSDMMAVL